VHTQPIKHATIIHFVLGAILLAYVLVVNGAVPGVLSPTAAQVFWLIGFSESFANYGSLYAHNFGLPMPAPISFGMASALPAAVLLKLGVGVASAYALVFAAWLSVAFVGAFFFVRHFGVGQRDALLSATIWCTFPIVWQHHLYSALALGVAMLPAYFLMAILVCGGRFSIWSSLGLASAAIIAVFQDGYTFMMFALGTGILLLGVLAKRWHSLSRELLYRCIVVAASFGVAYALYAAYEGRSGFGAEPIDFFRGWGASIEFFFTPTYGILALPDWLGLSIDRSPDDYFGDASTFVSTFCALIMLIALYGAFTKKVSVFKLIVFGLIALVGFYMSLGPTVKFLTFRGAGDTQLMHEASGWFSTGSAAISENLPGFKSMRASYRWAALGIFGCWAIFVLMLAGGRVSSIARWVMIAVLLLFNVPSPGQFHEYWHHRIVINDVVNEIETWRPDFKLGETVAFLPYSNDFLINYAASALKIRTFNAGGDKNVVYATQYWPEEMLEFEQGQIGSGFGLKVKSLLESGKATAVALPYLSLLWAAHDWPTDETNRNELSTVASGIAADPRYQVVYRDHYAVIRLKPEAEPLGVGAVWAAIPPIDLDTPVSFSSDKLDFDHLVGRGWYLSDPVGTWSKKKSASILVDASDIPDEASFLRATFTAYTPNDTCTTVEIASGGNSLLKERYCSLAGMVTVDLPKDKIAANGQIDFIVDTLRSPSEYGSGDGRSLGIFLQSLTVSK